MKLIILDRDGVINEDSSDYIKTVDEWVAIPDSMNAIARLNRGGYRVTIATNQSGISRGLFDLETLAEMHKKLLQQANQAGGHIDGIFFCPHGPNDNCDCRKPKTGLFKQIQARMSTNLEEVPCVGDSLRDLEAGVKMGCTPYLVRTGKGATTEKEQAEKLPANTAVFNNLMEVAIHLVPDDPFANKK